MPYATFSIRARKGPPPKYSLYFLISDSNYMLLVFAF
jgi:hypothetical protein